MLFFTIRGKYFLPNIFLKNLLSPMKIYKLWNMNNYMNVEH